MDSQRSQFYSRNLFILQFALRSPVWLLEKRDTSGNRNRMQHSLYSKIYPYIHILPFGVSPAPCYDTYIPTFRRRLPWCCKEQDAIHTIYTYTLCLAEPNAGIAYNPEKPVQTSIFIWLIYYIITTFLSLLLNIIVSSCNTISMRWDLCSATQLYIDTRLLYILFNIIICSYVYRICISICTRIFQCRISQSQGPGAHPYYFPFTDRSSKYCPIRPTIIRHLYMYMYALRGI